MDLHTALNALLVMAVIIAVISMALAWVIYRLNQEQKINESISATLTEIREELKALLNERRTLQ